MWEDGGEVTLTSVFAPNLRMKKWEGFADQSHTHPTFENSMMTFLFPVSDTQRTVNLLGNTIT